MSQVSCGEFHVGAPLIHDAIELRECPPQRGVVLGHHDRQAGAEETGVQAPAPQLIRHPPCRDGARRQREQRRQRFTANRPTEELHGRA